MIQRKPSKFSIWVNTNPRTFVRWLRRGGVPLGKDHKPIAEKPHVHPRHLRRRA